MADQIIDNIVAAMMPNLKKQQQGMYDYLLQLAQRQGVRSAMRRAGEAVAPYAKAAGDAAAKGGIEATRMGLQKSQFEKKLAQRQKEWEDKLSQWQKQFGASQDQQKFANLMATAGMTGLTPEMLQKMGYNPANLGLPTVSTRAGVFDRSHLIHDRSNQLPSYNLGGTNYSTYGYKAPSQGQPQIRYGPRHPARQYL